MNRRQFLLMAVALAGEAQLVASRTNASQTAPPPLAEEAGADTERWLWTTGPAEFGPTLRTLMNGTSTSVYLPLTRKS